MKYTLSALFEDGDGNSIIVRDHAELDSMVDDLLETDLDENAVFNIVERPSIPPLDLPDHQFSIDMWMGQDVTAVYFIGQTASGEVGQWFSVNPNPIENAPELYYDTRSAARFPADAAISIGDLRNALHEFLDNGGVRPECIAWQPYKDDPS
ncbi:MULTISPECIES: Imm1 family immunity protein [Actinoalloteichus]|uniref:Imm1 family immunity protein n=1 Tax=Actinoalloteichus TaxID=65496 RepID=UPI0009513AD0|nr:MULTISPECIES: Imm1 family immunity protein [Actinoalloteichus]